MAHARRKFHDLHVVHVSPINTEALERISALYVIEREVRREQPELRQAARQLKAKPLLESLHGWLQDALTRLSAKSETSKAIRYTNPES